MPLLYAALEDHVTTAWLLLEHGALVDVPDESAWTSLHIAANDGAGKVSRLLLAHGANPKAKTVSGKTPLDVVTAEVALILPATSPKNRSPCSEPKVLPMF